MQCEVMEARSTVLGTAVRRRELGKTQPAVPAKRSNLPQATMKDKHSGPSWLGPALHTAQCWAAWGPQRIAAACRWMLEWRDDI